MEDEPIHNAAERNWPANLSSVRPQQYRSRPEEDLSCRARTTLEVNFDTSMQYDLLNFDLYLESVAPLQDRIVGCPIILPDLLGGP